MKLWIKELREQQGMTQKELAEKTKKAEDDAKAAKAKAVPHGKISVWSNRTLSKTLYSQSNTPSPLMKISKNMKPLKQAKI